MQSIPASIVGADDLQAQHECSETEEGAVPEKSWKKWLEFQLHGRRQNFP